MTLPRRAFLRGAGVTLALPLLEAGAAQPPCRMLIIANNLGVTYTAGVTGSF